MNRLTLPQALELPREEFLKIFAPKGEEIFLSLQQQDFDDVLSQYERSQEEQVEIIHPEHPLYPLRLLTLFLDGAPALLFAKGDTNLLWMRSVAVVGSRDAEDIALELAEEIAGKAVGKGWNVISGYARGVDISAHLGALKAGGGTTMVLGYGLHHFRPRSALSELNWEPHTLQLSQFHPQEQWQKPYGMMRNRLMVGLSKVAVVVQAEDKSGSLNTGIMALKAGIPLFVLSGRFFSSSPSGNEILIQQGGKELRRLEELEEELAKIN